MDLITKAKELRSINSTLRGELGYTPYILVDGVTTCASCHSPMRNDANLMATHEEAGIGNEPTLVHDCENCNYYQGSNLDLKSRIAGFRKEISIKELSRKEAEKNEYMVPLDKYWFRDQVSGTLYNVTEAQLRASVMDFNGVEDNLVFTDVNPWIDPETIKSEDAESEVIDVSMEGETSEVETVDDVPGADNLIDPTTSTESAEFSVETPTKVVEVEPKVKTVETTKVEVKPEVIPEPEPEPTIVKEVDTTSGSDFLNIDINSADKLFGKDADLSNEDTSFEIEEDDENLSGFVEIDTNATSTESFIETVTAPSAPVNLDMSFDIDDDDDDDDELGDIPIPTVATNDGTFEIEEDGDDVLAALEMSDDVLSADMKKFMVDVGGAEDTSFDIDDDDDDDGLVDSDFDIDDDDDDDDDVPTPTEHIVDNGGTFEIDDEDEGDLSDEMNTTPKKDFFSKTSVEDDGTKSSDKTSNEYFGGSTRVDQKIPDANIADMVRKNKDDKEKDVFKLLLRDTDNISQSVQDNRMEQLREMYEFSPFKKVIEGVSAFFRKRSRPIKTKVYIDERTREYVVVDFQGGIRVIFIDFQFGIAAKDDYERKINGALKPSFEADLTTCTIYSNNLDDMGIYKTVKAISKSIAFALDIPNVFTLMDVVYDSDEYYFITDEKSKDKAEIEKFEAHNSCVGTEVPTHHSVGIISRFTKGIPDDWWRTKEYQVKSAIQQGGEVELKDLIMLMNASMGYAVIEDKKSNIIEVTITKYVESLDVMVRNGFALLVGMVIREVKLKFPNRPLHMYYELDPSALPSPTITRYIRDKSITPLEQSGDIESLNKISSIISRGDTNKDGLNLFSEGRPFGSKNFKTPYWRTFKRNPEVCSGDQFSKESRCVDPRLFGKYSFSKTMLRLYGESTKGVNINDESARRAFMRELGIESIYQKKMMIFKITVEFGKEALNLIMNSSAGTFSVSDYVKYNKNSVIDDNYMNGNFSQNQSLYGSLNNNIGPNMVSNAQAQANQQQVFQNMLAGQQMNNGGFNNSQSFNGIQNVF